MFGNALWLEYRVLLDRPVWGDATSATECLEVLAALAQRGRWVIIYYGWRPNLPDEADNHLIELALAATRNVNRALEILERLDEEDHQAGV